MDVLFSSSGNITNQISNAVSQNPWETHDFMYSVLYQDIPEALETITNSYFKLSGEVPNNLTIDNNGVINGNILILGEQQNKIIDMYPKEPMKLDGSNCFNGRPKAMFVDFNFTVTRYIEYDKIDVGTGEVLKLNGSWNTNLTIKIIRNNNIDNFVFVKNYLNQGYPLKIGDDTYTSSHLQNFLMRHPGPFKL